ncbi:MAG: multiheme c-type cytochrome [Pyrinomonadaceae bacterium]
MSKSKLKNLSNVLAILGTIIVLWIPLKSLSQNLPSSQGKTFDPSPDWRPTHAAGGGARYASDTACTECHTEAATQPATPMAKALETPAESRILRQHPQLIFKIGPYTYSITRRGDQSIYTVTDGTDSLSVPILYAFGQGKVGQTYVLEHKGKHYESRVSFYGRINQLDFTLGASRETPLSLETALGRVLDSASLNDCFSCHSTASVSGGQLQLDKMTPGVTCQGCHGPGEKHIAAMKTRSQAWTRAEASPQPADNHILNPGRFDTEGVTQFCGACHRSWIQVQMMGIQGAENVRFQPYRIFNSKCYDHTDKRISCTACHDPHTELVKETSYYDAKCQACHQTTQKLPVSAKKVRICPVGKQNCASCHMPKVELPGAHFKFTDHQIRIARPGEAYPN